MKNSKAIHVRQETIAAIRKITMPVLEKMGKSDNVPDNVVVDNIRKTLGDDLAKIKMNEDEVHYLDLILAAIARGIAIKNVRAFVISRSEEYDAASAVSLPEDPVYEEAMVLLGEKRLVSPSKSQEQESETETETEPKPEPVDDSNDKEDVSDSDETTETDDDTMVLIGERRLATSSEKAIKFDSRKVAEEIVAMTDDDCDITTRVDKISKIFDGSGIDADKVKSLAFHFATGINTDVDIVKYVIDYVVSEMDVDDFVLTHNVA